MNICSVILVSLYTMFSLVLYAADGKASFYSDKMQGQRTASGERYNKTLYTAAHASLPFDTLVKVINKQNGKSVVVRINDRMSQSRHSIIDLSKAAAAKIEIVRAGVGDVQLQELTKKGAQQQEVSSAVSEVTPAAAH